jgi:hypothetical protein
VQGLGTFMGGAGALFEQAIEFVAFAENRLQ